MAVRCQGSRDTMDRTSRGTGRMSITQEVITAPSATRTVSLAPEGPSSSPRSRKAWRQLHGMQAAVSSMHNSCDSPISQDLMFPLKVSVPLVWKSAFIPSRSKFSANQSAEARQVLGRSRSQTPCCFPFAPSLLYDAPSPLKYLLASSLSFSPHRKTPPFDRCGGSESSLRRSSRATHRRRLPTSPGSRRSRTLRRTKNDLRRRRARLRITSWFC